MAKLLDAKFEIIVPINRQQILEDTLTIAFEGCQGVPPPETTLDPLVDQYYAPARDDATPTHCGFRGAVDNAQKSLLADLRTDLQDWWSGQFNGQFTAAAATTQSTSTDKPVQWSMDKLARLNDSATWLSRGEWNAHRDSILGPLVTWEPDEPFPAATTRDEADQTPTAYMIMLALHEAVDEEPSPQMWAISDWAHSFADRFWPCSVSGRRPVEQYAFRAFAPRIKLTKALQDRQDKIPEEMRLGITNLDGVLIWVAGQGLIVNGIWDIDRLIDDSDLQKIGRASGYTQQEIEELIG